jgi:hypothetical protein
VWRDAGSCVSNRETQLLFVSIGEIMPKWNFEKFSRIGRDFTKQLGFPDHQLDRVPLEYKEIRLPKRGGGARRLMVPNAKLKLIQQCLLRRVLCLFPCHPACKGFRKGRSIVDHGIPHTGKPFVILMDVRDFFPSTSKDRIGRYFSEYGWTPNRVEQIVRLVCDPTTNGLPQGAPSSPVITNIVNWEMDARLTGYCKKIRYRYSRYADDLAFSPIDPDVGTSPVTVIKVVSSILSEYGYSLNNKKTRILRSSGQQKVTGLVVNEKCSLPRSIKRRIRAAEYRSQRGLVLSNVAEPGEKSVMTPTQLNSWLSYLRMIQEKST